MELAKLAADFAFQQEGISTNLVGMNTVALLDSNMDTLINGLTELEKEVLEYLKQK